MPNPDSARLNRHWAGLLVEELVRNGITRFVLSPGSRSTPLVAAVAANPAARVRVHVDERGAAFAALGMARADARGAAWITTSGTAAANGLPAVVEASLEGLPLVLLTADRPPELRDAAANQAIDQVGLFGRHVRWQVDLPAPDPAIDPAYVLTTVDQAVHRARGTDPGPVHLNCMFREPLVPGPDEPDAAVETGPIAAWRASSAPYTRYAAVHVAVDAEPLAQDLAACARILIVAGRLSPDQAGPVRRLAERTGCPVVADVLSQLHLDPAAGVVRHADLLLARPDALPAPDAVLLVGRPPVSKRLGTWLAGLRPRVFAVVADGPSRVDPSHVATHRLASIGSACDGLAARVGARYPAAWFEPWLHADAAVEAELADALAGPDLSEPFVARAVARLSGPDRALVVASSMPVRDLDAFAGPRAKPLPVHANRGASGIDGTVATAAGVCEASGRPVTLLIGDLALLHDLNSLALLRGRPVVVVAVNNDGGGIFSFLPIAKHPDVFEPYFGTPHGLSFAHAAALYGLEYDAPTTAAAFEAAYRAACERPGPTLLEVRTDRRDNRAVHAALLDRAVRAAFGAP